ncbi:PREDICTED: uncharacterized protein LOC104606471 [Nelumbo nucifera]|uniref:Uncharacterized protein LOC104606471 n=2 Tax=Nelumbo nucifera TaxID=4432 RepID=A0A1U8B210_NELNU|nr:PREDICTED: uncharacterized protein LOC104606471 [Nelumbo nucifera]DAD47512.1 TPA_asm: hypothetical protein HUJ06_017449 [Nelumbo nucifera]
MNKLGGTSKLLIVYVFIISSLVISTFGDEAHQEEHQLEGQKPNAAERAIGIRDIISPWHKFRSLIKIAWLNFRPPDSQKITETPHSASEAMKDAAAKSFKTTTETAKNAAKVAGDAVHKTADKLKTKVSGSGGHEDEL